MLCGGKNIDYFLLTIFIYGSAKKADEKRKVKRMSRLWQN